MNIIEPSKSGFMSKDCKNTLWKCLCLSRCKQNGGGLINGTLQYM